jgi:hypothetical protein
MMPEFLFLFPGARSGSGFIPARLPDFIRFNPHSDFIL